MIKFEETEVVGWRHAIRGMRNAKNSWDKSDSKFGQKIFVNDPEGVEEPYETDFVVGINDHKLMMQLRNAGTDHRKYLRMIVVYVDITAPLYWWKEFDTYKVGTVANSCSTMHTIHEKEFTLDDFSHEHLLGLGNHYDEREVPYLDFSPLRDESCMYSPLGMLTCCVIPMLNLCRQKYLVACKTEPETGLSAKDIWWQMIQLLPSTYNQKRTVMMNYEVLANIYKSRNAHKLDEWRVGFCDWIRELPHSELITGEVAKSNMPFAGKNYDGGYIHGSVNGCGGFVR